MPAVSLSLCLSVSLVPDNTTYPQQTVQTGGRGPRKGVIVQSISVALTSLSNQQEEPHAARQIQQQRDRVPRVPQQVHDGKEGAVHLGLEPAALHSLGLEHGMRRRVVVLGRPADERRREAPGEPDQQEAQDVVDGGRLRSRGVGDR